MKCEVRPCPNIVDSHISKTTEKLIFLYFLVATSCLCVVLYLSELSCLTCQCSMKCPLKRYIKKCQGSASVGHKLGIKLTCKVREHLPVTRSALISPCSYSYQGRTVPLLAPSPPLLEQIIHDVCHIQHYLDPFMLKQKV